MPLTRMLRKLRQPFRKITQIHHRAEYTLPQLRVALGRIEVRQQRAARPGCIEDSTIQVFSQFNEDGMIQYLLDVLPPLPNRFVEFGVENYEEANTRFLLHFQGWQGLVMDSDTQNISAIRAAPYYFREPLQAEVAFVTRENINSLLSRFGFTGQIGLLSIDIDGNDYWIWEAISVIDPAIVIVEYSFRFGVERAVAVPYSENFNRRLAHPSMLYFGASIKAMVQLGERKGYRFIGTNSHRNNAFFLRTDLLNDRVPAMALESRHIASPIREARASDFALSYLNAREEQALLKGLPVIDVETGVQHLW